MIKALTFLTKGADVTLFNGLKGVMQEGIDLATNALAVMTDYADDQWVQKMAKFILGTDDYAGKFLRVKGESRNMNKTLETEQETNSTLIGTFAAVKAYERDPSPLLPSNLVWKTMRTSADIVSN